VHVDQDVIHLAELAHRAVDLAEGGVPGAHEEVARHVDDTEAHPRRALHHAGSAARLGVDVVHRAHHAGLAIEVGDDLAPVVGVVAERDGVDPGAQELVGDLRCDAETGGGVLAVDHHEGRVLALAQEGQPAQQHLAARTPHDVADKEDAHLGLGCGGGARATISRGRRGAVPPALSRRTLRHTRGMAGER